MKKTSTVVYVLLGVASLVLLWLWYYLGFYLIDSPLDMVVAVVWWACIAVGIWAVVRSEKRRQERVRTVYVGEAQRQQAGEGQPPVTVPGVFNPEKGLMELDGRTPQDAMFALLKDLEYGFGREKFPDREDFVPAYMVRTREFKPEKQDDDGGYTETTWRGEVVKPEGDQALRWQFDDPQELGEILAVL